jgi:hypothetical protein
MSLMFIQSGIITELASAFPTIPIEYENVSFNPSGKSIYFRVITEELRSTRIVLGHHTPGSKRRAGRCTVIVVGQQGVGDGQVKNTAQQVRQHFESKIINGAFIDAITVITVGSTDEGYINSVLMDFQAYNY